MNWLRHLVTGSDNATHDLGRWSWIGSFLAVIGAAAHNAMHGVTLDVQSIATALASIAGAHGVALWAKKDTEPTKEPQA